LELENLARTKPVQQHQGDEAEIAKSTKAPPEPTHLFGGPEPCSEVCPKRNDSALGLFEPQTRHGNASPAEAKRTPRPINAFAESILAGDLRLVMKAVQVAHRDCSRQLVKSAAVAQAAK